MVRKFFTRIYAQKYRWNITKIKKWFFSLIYFVLFIFNVIIPPCVLKGCSWTEIGEIIGGLFLTSWELYIWLAIFFHLALIALIIAIFLFKEKVSGLFSFYIGLNYIFIALTQEMAYAKEYGSKVLTEIFFSIFSEMMEKNIFCK